MATPIFRKVVIKHHLGCQGGLHVIAIKLSLIGDLFTSGSP